MGEGIACRGAAAIRACWLAPRAKKTQAQGLGLNPPCRRVEETNGADRSISLTE
jgi:hypothetical protein